MLQSAFSIFYLYFFSFSYFVQSYIYFFSVFCFFQSYFLIYFSLISLFYFLYPGILSVSRVRHTCTLCTCAGAQPTDSLTRTTLPAVRAPILPRTELFELARFKSGIRRCKE